jgi:glycosyltransferase involved in cell wall biosynthesis
MVQDVTEPREPASQRNRAARLRVLHVVLQAGPTNSQWNEHCLPVAGERDITVCSLFPASVDPDPRIAMTEGDGSVLGGLDALRRTLRAGSYDVVHVHAAASAAMLLAAKVVERRGLRDVVFTLHTSWPNLRPRNRALAAVCFAVFPSVVACSRSSAASIPRVVRRLGRARLDVVPNGVDLDRIDRVAQLTSPDHDSPTTEAGLIFLTVGRLIPVKEHSTLLTAFAQAARHNDRLLVVGDGPLREALERQASELGIAEQVDFPGLLPRDDVYRLLAHADVFASPSRIEGLPVSVLEAMAAGLPVVLSDIPPHREIIATHDLTDLVAVGDTHGLAAAMRGLQTLSAADRRATGARGRQLVAEHFSLGAMSRAYGQIYARFPMGTSSSTGGVA